MAHPPLPNADPNAAQLTAQAAELRHRELVVHAVAAQVETVMSLVGATAHDEQWRGPAARAYARAVEGRLRGLVDARRSLDLASQALAFARTEAERRAATSALPGAGNG